MLSTTVRRLSPGPAGYDVHDSPIIVGDAFFDGGLTLDPMSGFRDDPQVATPANWLLYSCKYTPSARIKTSCEPCSTIRP